MHTCKCWLGKIFTIKLCNTIWTNNIFDIVSKNGLNQTFNEGILYNIYNYNNNTTRSGIVFDISNINNATNNTLIENYLIEFWQIDNFKGVWIS